MKQGICKGCKLVEAEARISEQLDFQRLDTRSWTRGTVTLFRRVVRDRRVGGSRIARTRDRQW
jgi:hypothetical protein